MNCYHLILTFYRKQRSFKNQEDKIDLTEQEGSNIKMNFAKAH